MINYEMLLKINDKARENIEKYKVREKWTRSPADHRL